VSALRSAATKAVSLVGSAALATAAVPYRNRAKILDVAGGCCLVVGTARISTAAAWLVAGAWLTLRAVGIERSGR